MAELFREETAGMDASGGFEKVNNAGFANRWSIFRLMKASISVDMVRVNQKGMPRKCDCILYPTEAVPVLRLVGLQARMSFVGGRILRFPSTLRLLSIDALEGIAFHFVEMEWSSS